MGIRQGRRYLYWLLDELEQNGFRFQVHRGPSHATEQAGGTSEPWAKASDNWASLTQEERRIHRELFPQEDLLLRSGYDWDHEHVYRDGKTLPMDAYGRRTEETEGVLYEWVKISNEYTWRRYPLYVLPQRERTGVSPTPAATESVA